MLAAGAAYRHVLAIAIRTVDGVEAPQMHVSELEYNQTVIRIR